MDFVGSWFGGEVNLFSVGPITSNISIFNTNVLISSIDSGIFHPVSISHSIEIFVVPRNPDLVVKTEIVAVIHIEFSFFDSFVSDHGILDLDVW